MENDINITEHAYLRIKQRNGWNRKTANRMLDRIYDDGLRIKDIKGYLRVWIKNKIKSELQEAEYVLYGKQVYIFREHNLITVLAAPCRKSAIEYNE